MADGGGSGGAAPLDHRGSSQQSVELDILQLSQRWEAQRTIRNGDTPGQALRKGGPPEWLREGSSMQRNVTH